MQEEDKVWTDLPMAQKESLKLFMALTALCDMKRIRALYISAAFLGAEELKREVFIVPPKDIKIDGEIWQLKKPLYGLKDAGRKFWLCVKKILIETNFKKLKSDEAFYYKVFKGKLHSMVLLHVDDFMMSGGDTFIKETTDVFKKNLSVSKVEDDKFRYCGLDVRMDETKVEVSMDESSSSLEEWPLQVGKKNDPLNSEERKVSRKMTTNFRPNLSYNVLRMYIRSRDATLKDMKYANASVRETKGKTSKVVYTKSSKSEDVVVSGISDGSHKPGEKAVGGQFVVMSTTESSIVFPLFWRSKLIQKVCKSPKDAETINLGTVVDLGCNFAKQIEELLYESKRKVKTKVNTDSLRTIESVASSHKVERRNMRAYVADMKQRLENGEVTRYCWVQDEHMISYILTKDKKEKFGLDDLMRDNKLYTVRTEDKSVQYEDGEFSLWGRKLRDKLMPKTKVPTRRKVVKANDLKNSHSVNEKEEEEDEARVM